jgi:hypothetical protein
MVGEKISQRQAKEVRNKKRRRRMVYYGVGWKIKADITGKTQVKVALQASLKQKYSTQNIAERPCANKWEIRLFTVQYENNKEVYEKNDSFK